MAQQKFLDLTGLTSYDKKIKSTIDSKDATTLQQAKSYANGLGANYDPAGTAQTKVNALEKGQVTTNKNDIATLKTGKADKSTTLAGYGIGDAYTKGQTDSAIKSAIANSGHLKRTIVTQLPEASAADEHTIYMIKKSSPDGTNAYDEYMAVSYTHLDVYKRQKALEAVTNQFIVKSPDGKRIVLEKGKITADALQSNNYVAPGHNSVYAQAGTFYNLSDGSITSKNFVVDQYGNVNLKGTVYATGGSFTGDIVANSLTLGSNVTIPEGNVAGSSSYIKKDVTLGYVSQGSNGFQVSSNGLLKASNAIIYGTVYASSGRCV